MASSEDTKKKLHKVLGGRWEGEESGRKGDFTFYFQLELSIELSVTN